MKKVLLFLFVILLVACSTPPPTETPEATQEIVVNQLVREPEVVDCELFTLELIGSDYYFRCMTPGPGATPTLAPTVTAEATGTPLPTETPIAPIPPFVGASPCPEEAHNPRIWHSIWNSEPGCRYTHFHGNNPHEVDDIFGTGIYTAFGGEISYQFQTFSGAGAHHEQPGPESAFENDIKHAGYKWLTIREFPCNTSVPGILNGAQNCIVAGRLQFHAHLTQVDALVRFHSVWLEAMVCNVGVDGPENCGIYRGGGHLDLGRLNLPRGACVPLPNDPNLFCNDGIPAERQPYRIHTSCDNPVFGLDSWQSETNTTYTITDTLTLSVGYGVHFKDPFGCVQPDMVGNPQSPDNLAITDFICYGEPGCNFNASQMSLFRLWVIIPEDFDNGVHDTDSREGYFSFNGYTDRYGVPVTGCTEIGLDCVFVEAIGVPVGKSRLRAGDLQLNQDFDYHVCGSEICSDEDAPSVDWIKYP